MPTDYQEISEDILVPFRKNKLFYGWVVVIASLIVGTTSCGARFSFGVFFKSLEGEFELTRAATSGVFSTYMVLYSLVGVLGGWAIDKYGPRIIIGLMGLFTGLSLLLTSQTSSTWQLFISYSLLLSIGTGATYTVLATIVSRWFYKRRGLAMGITTASLGLGIVAVAPFATYLISNLGWRMSYIMMGFIAWLVIISFSVLFKSDPSQVGALPDGMAPDTGKISLQGKEVAIQPIGLSLPTALKTRSFWLLVFFFLLWSSCQHLVLTHIVPHATDIAISAMEAAVVLSLIGAGDVAGRVIMGAVSDRLGRKATVIICALLQVGAMIWLIWLQELLMFYVFAVVFGFCFGGAGTSATAVVGDIFGLRSLGIIMGVVNVGFGLGAAIGPAMGGFIFDVSNNYTLAFLIGIIVLLASALCMALIRVERRIVT